MKKITINDLDIYFFPNGHISHALNMHEKIWDNGMDYIWIEDDY